MVPPQQFASGVIGVGTGPAHSPAVANVLRGAVRPPEGNERGGHVVRVHLQLDLAPRAAHRVQAVERVPERLALRGQFALCELLDVQRFAGLRTRRSGDSGLFVQSGMGLANGKMLRSVITICNSKRDLITHSI